MRKLSALIILAAALGACTFNPKGGGNGNPSGGGGSIGSGGTGLGGPPPTGAGGTPPATPCVGLQCQQSTCTKGNCMVPACANGARTTVSGTIFDPAGQNPLYNITVYVPNAPLADIADGPSCDPCDPATGTSNLSGSPIVVVRTGVDGKFTLGAAAAGADVPAGSNIPLVIQVGKWRRAITMPTVTACQDNPLTDMDLSRLPKNQSEGHIPKMAITTGNLDALECLLRKVGVQDSEFTPETGTGRVNFYGGGTPGTPGTSSYDATLNGGAPFTLVHPAGGGPDWWDSLDNLKKYDIILHSCEGGAGQFGPNMQPASVKSMAARQALQDFADMGGRVFASHWHVYWFEQGPPAFQSIATFNHRQGLPQMYTATIDTSTSNGMALSQWMVNVGGSPAPGGTVALNQNASNTTVDMVAGGNTSTRWIYAANRTPQAVQYMSATTPVPGGSCGRVVVSDLHVSAGGSNSDMPNKPFPTGCVTTTLSPQEKVLEFMLFDIASCVVPVVQ
jgi:hypothetical protein